MTSSKSITYVSP